MDEILKDRMLSATYAELVTLRDEGKLIAGMQYRITDYVTTTAQKNTSSAGHQFDVIVTADNENTLNEVARACLHWGDTYFSKAGAKLEAWQIWYSLDNNSERFAWADTENGKGVIYRMIDEHNNDLPYDFKNILFTRCELKAPEAYVSEGQDNKYKEKLSENIRTMFANGVCSYIWAGIPDYKKYWGDINGLLSDVTGVVKDYFTFSDIEGIEVSDASLGSHCYENKMGVFNNMPRNQYALPNNVFFGNNCYDNSLGGGCFDNSFGDTCHNNSFGSGSSCNCLGDSCQDNILGPSCCDNNFSNYCCNNGFGAECCYNSFGDSFFYNSLGNTNNYNIFGDGCEYNRFGNICCCNIFGDNCECNRFGSASFDNELNSFYQHITLGEGVQHLTLQNNTKGDQRNYVQNYKVANGTSGESNNPLVIFAVRGRESETFIGMDSEGKLRVFCLADLAGFGTK